MLFRPTVLICATALLVASASANVALDVSQMEILEELYYSTNGPKWTYNPTVIHSPVKWDFTKDGTGAYLMEGCTFSGVDCNSSPIVYDLGLNNYGLAGSLPDSFGGLVNITSIALYGNALTGALPKTMGAMTELWYFNAQSNALSGALPGELGALKKMQYLYLDDNKFEGSIPAEYGSFSEIVLLSLQLNKLSGPIPKEIGDLTSAAVLYLGYNQLSGAIPDEICNLTTTSIIDVSNNLFECKPACVGPNVNTDYLLKECK